MVLSSSSVVKLKLIAGAAVRRLPFSQQAVQQHKANIPQSRDADASFLIAKPPITREVIRGFQLRP